MKYFLSLVLMTSFVYSQNCKITIDDKTNRPMLIGVTPKDAFLDSNFSKWFNLEYADYKPDTSYSNYLKNLLGDKKIKIVMGTWCSDSRREVPRFIKILDQIDFNDSNLTIINVDRQKKGIAEETDGLNIELVPTFIIYNNDIELGRIVETPEDTLEKDLYKILLSN